MKPIYFLDEAVIHEITIQNSFYLIKLLIISYLFFYFLPRKLFPQPKTSSQIEVIIINMIFMVTYVEIFVTLLVFLKLFSIVTFIIFLFLTKLFFVKFYYKKSVKLYLDEVRVNLMIKVLDILDNPSLFFNQVIELIKRKIIEFQKSITFYNSFSFILYFIIIFYIFIETMTRGLETISYSIVDTAQFVDWVNHLQDNILYADNQVGADFYGISILMFFVNSFTNIDVIILFSIYPVLLFIALYLSIFFVLKDFTQSNFSAIFGVITHGIFLMSPLAIYVLSGIITTNHPDIAHFLGFSYYIPTEENLKGITYFHFESYYRYLTGMAYEHSSVFVLLNAYFLIKALEFKTDKYLLLYSLTLLLVFTFHGGGAIILIIISLFIAFNSVLFFKLDLKILKKGLIAILFSAIVGNLWMLSVFKYGIPKDFGAAAPFLDKLLHTKQYAKRIAESGSFEVSFIYLNNFHYFLMGLLGVNFFITLFRKNRFYNISFLLIIFSIFLIYFGPTFGFPNVAHFSRLSEYFFFGVTLLFGVSFFYIAKFLSKWILLIFFYILMIISILAVPKWINHKKLNLILNQTEWSAIPEFILKIDKKNIKFSWTLVSYVQDFSKVKNKAFHINSADFILNYSPLDRYLKIPTPKIYIVIEDFTNPHTAMNEWYYRWRSRIENHLRAWVATYAINHNNIKIAYRSKMVTIYEIDNREYIKFLTKKNKG